MFMNVQANTKDGIIAIKFDSQEENDRILYAIKAEFENDFIWYTITDLGAFGYASIGMMDNSKTKVVTGRIKKLAKAEKVELTVG